MISEPHEIHELARRLSIGEFPKADSELLDGLLNWLAGRKTPDANAVQAGFEQSGTSPEEARRLTLLYLDATLFAHAGDPYRLFGLTPDAKEERIRSRHKWLLQVFHPDRHASDKEWFTARSEQINQAYGYLKGKSTHLTSSQVNSYGNNAANRTSTTGQHDTQFGVAKGKRFDRNDKTRLRRTLKNYFGSEASLQQKLFLILTVVPIVLLLGVYLSNRGDIGVNVLSRVDPSNAQSAERKEANSDVELISDNENDIFIAQNKSVIKNNDPNQMREREEISKRKEYIENDGTGEGPQEGVNSPKTVDASKRNMDLADASEKYDTKSIKEEEVSEMELKIEKAEAYSDESKPEETEIKEVVDENIVDETPIVQGGEGNAGGKRDELADATEIEKPVDLKKEPEKLEVSEDEVIQISEADKEQVKKIETRVSDEIEETTNELDGENWGRENVKKDDNKEHVSPTDKDEKSGKERLKEQEAGRSTEKETKQAVYSKLPSETRSQDDIGEIRALLETYKVAYRNSDIDTFGKLFDENAQTKHAKGKQEIEDKYGEFFEKTKSRSVQFHEIKISLLGGHQFKVDTSYTADWTYYGGAKKHNSGIFKMHIVTVGNDLKIWRIEY